MDMVFLWSSSARAAEPVEGVPRGGGVAQGADEGGGHRRARLVDQPRPDGNATPEDAVGFDLDRRDRLTAEADPGAPPQPRGGSASLDHQRRKPSNLHLVDDGEDRDAEDDRLRIGPALGQPDQAADDEREQTSRIGQGSA
jgi:hypothetical protein